MPSVPTRILLGAQSSMHEVLRFPFRVGELVHGMEPEERVDEDFESHLWR